ncbi:hypothetical protein [Pantoea sp. Z09]|uniref:hypothetical protein n=1 Tax=Pantoea sp. Z09 TaxID=2886821 RepID=UPI001EFE9DA2|nr:hypothetical protein [Pantoea sp. Z09]
MNNHSDYTRKRPVLRTLVWLFTLSAIAGAGLTAGSLALSALVISVAYLAGIPG